MAGFPTIFLLSSLLCYGLVSPFAILQEIDLIKGGPTLKIAAFNVQVFGLKKMDKPEVVKTLVKIIRRYDLIVIQEIRDSSLTAFPALLAEVNKGLPQDQTYQSIVSERLGRTSSKEQYGYVYKPSRVKVSDSYHYDDGPEAVGKAKNPQDAFQREPFIVRFSAPDTVVSDFAMVVIHTSPRDAVKEIDHLKDVYEDVVNKWNLKDVIITGDFNAGCSYVTDSEWAHIRLRHDPRFVWLIGDDVDTTVAKSDCPYDRFVIAGDMMKTAYVPGTAKAFRFNEAYGLNQDQTEEVSDHYPIEMELYGRAKDGGKADVESLLSVTVTDPDAKVSDADNLLLFLTEYFEGFKTNNLYTSEGDIAVLSAVKTSLSNEQASKELERLKGPLKFMSADVFDVARMHITPDDQNLTMEIKCDAIKGGCEVTLKEKTI